MNALQKPSVTVNMQKGLDATQAGPAEPASPNPYLEADRRNARPPRPTRVTLDLDQHRHDVVKNRGLTIAQILRALIDEMEADPALWDRVLRRVTG